MEMICTVNSCIEKVIGGFEEIADVGHLQDPTATIPGMVTMWCSGHESSVLRVLSGRGRFVSVKELKQMPD